MTSVLSLPRVATSGGAGAQVSCQGASARAKNPCANEATRVVKFRRPLVGPVESIDYEVRLCDSHAARVQVGDSVGRAKVVRKRRL